MFKLYFAIAVALLASPNLLSAAQWHTGEGIVTLANITPEEARRQALDIARQDALSQARLEIVGATASRLTEMSGSGDTQVYDHFSRFIQTFTRGLIIKEETIQDCVDVQPVPGTNRTEPVYRIKLRALIESDTTAPDPAFTLSLKLNRDSFREGETISVELQATKDCYVTIFNLYALDSLRVLFPNEAAPNNRLKAGESRAIPGSNDIWDIPLSLLSGKERDVESVLVVATKESVSFPEWEGSVVGGAVAMDRALTTLSGWLAKMPSDQRTEATATYTIIK
jgi:hypothetical protein